MVRTTSCRFSYRNTLAACADASGTNAMALAFVEQLYCTAWKDRLLVMRTSAAPPR
jgi:hypothetical protein